MKWYVLGTVAAFVASVVGLALIVNQTVPTAATSPVKILFFLALLIGLWSGSTLVLYGLRRNLEHSFSLGFFIAAVCMALLLINKLL